jgi:hypothetical protein
MWLKGIDGRMWKPSPMAADRTIFDVRQPGGHTADACADALGPRHVNVSGAPGDFGDSLTRPARAGQIAQVDCNVRSG